MRIIAGDWKGRKIEAPLGRDVRPTSEKVKEAMFSMLMPYVDGAVVLDLFAGTGGLGLEALSRGADKCYFSDNSRESISLLSRNIANCKGEEYSVVLSGDYLRNLERINEKLDIIIMDPPYWDGLYETAFNSIYDLDLLKAGGVIVAEHNKDVILPENIKAFHRIKERQYGSIVLSIFSLE
ncbi:MAG: 16S rRNA (guanine(966)-N(2))-methyltransferase RsmD [Clostridia bacterium]|nr:16S rRNA (guanine(966)-N(2))-methyltransferase RsmD [Clostridia bacterium]